MAQLPLNTCPPTPRTLLRASLGDALLTVAVAVPAARAGRRSPAVLAAGLAGGALGIELNALARGRWAYRPTMPTVGGVGLVPLVQLPLLGLIAAALARRRATR